MTHDFLRLRNFFLFHEKSNSNDVLVVDKCCVFFQNWFTPIVDVFGIVHPSVCGFTPKPSEKSSGGPWSTGDLRSRLSTIVAVFFDPKKVQIDYE